MNLFIIFLIAISGIILAFFLMQVTSKSRMKGYDILPIFFILSIQLLSTRNGQPSYLPYGFLAFFVFVIFYSIYQVILNKNISLSKTILSLWRYLNIVSFGWLIGLIFLQMLH